MARMHDDEGVWPTQVDHTNVLYKDNRVTLQGLNINALKLCLIKLNILININH